MYGEHVCARSHRSRFDSFMLRKLFSLVSGSCCADNPDSPQHQEVLLPGTLYGMILKERIEDSLLGIRNFITQDVRRKDTTVDFFDGE
jgi:DNA-directed RNA polymerase I subunit RPA2